MRWASPAIFWLLLLPLALLPFLLRSRRRPPSLPTSLPLPPAPFLFRFASRLSSPLLLLALLFALLAAAQPQKIVEAWPVWGKGMDLVLAFDTSSSMLQRDLPPSRLAVAKEWLSAWFKDRRQRDDRLGLVLFARHAFTLCPLTFDHPTFLEMLSNVQIGAIADDTAIGDALATALSRLRRSKNPLRAILLVTDGENNAGQVHPIVAADLAAEMKIPIFPLLFGKEHATHASTSTTSPWAVLQDVARRSRGQAFSIQSPDDLKRALVDILERIDPARQALPRYQTRQEDLFPWFLAPALFLLLLVIGLETTVFRSFP